MKKIIITILCLCLFVSVSHAKWKYNPFADNFDYYESGYDDLTEYVEQTAWSVFYSDGSGDITELTLGAEGKVLKAHGTAAPTWENDNNDGGATAWDDVSDPDNNGLTTIDFDNAAENTILAGSYDAAGSFFTLQSDDADVANQMYLLDLDYSVDDDQALADYFRCQDAGGTVFTIQQDGDTDIAGDLAVGSDAHSSISVNGTTKYIQFGVHGDDVADTYVSYMDRASDTHSPTMVIARGRGTHANPTQVADNDIIGQIGFMGWDDTDNDMNFGAKILARVHGAAGNNDLPTEIAFGVAPDGAATPTEQFSLYDGVIAPITDDDVDLGTSALQFKDGFFDGTLEADAITEGGNAVFNTTEGATFVGLNSSGAVNLDDGVGDSPTLSFLDADNNYFALIKYDAGAGGLFNNEGAIRLVSSNDTNDYVEFSTAAGVTTMATVAGGDDGDLVITAAGGEIGFGNENLSTTGTFEAATITEGGNAVYNSTDDLFIKLAGDVATAGTYDFGSASVVLEIPNGTADVALANCGEMYLNETDEQICFHSGANGEISGEAALSLIYHISAVFDPDAICDGDVDRVFLFTLGDDFPEGIIIDEWKFSFEADPTTDADIDLKWASAFIGVADADVIDVLDTSDGVSSEDTDANINSGDAIAAGKVIYLEFGTAYTETGHQCIFDMWFHIEED